MGDAGNIGILERLSEIAPVRAVYGNCDGMDVRREYPEVNAFTIEKVKVVLKHIGGTPGHYDHTAVPALDREQPGLFVCGHSHILKVQYDHERQMLYVNPGAAGLQGWQQVRTLMLFTIDGENFRDMQVVEMPFPDSME